MQFADDFIEAQKLYRKHINDNEANASYVSLLFDHLLNMINESKQKKNEAFDAFVNILKGKKLVFNSLEKKSATRISFSSSSTSPSISSSQETVTRLIDPNDLISDTPSVAPEEDNLK